MLVATINPPAKKVVQSTPFTTDEFTASQMIAKCTKLVIGGDSSNGNNKIEFDVRFGNVYYETKPDGTQGRPMFQILVHYNTQFTQAELSDWGTDDSIVYEKIATKLGFQVVSTQIISDLSFGN